MAVPIQNVYYLLCYAWDRLDALDSVDVGALSGDRIENLLGKVLHAGMSHLMRRGLDRGYLPVEQEGRQLRGKVLRVRGVAIFSHQINPSVRQSYDVLKACAGQDSTIWSNIETAGGDLGRMTQAA